MEGLRNSNLQPCQLSRGPATSQLSRVLFSGSCLDLTKFGPSMHFSGVTPGDCYSLLYVLECPQPGHTFNFEKEHEADCMGVFAPGAPLDSVTPSGYCNAAFALPSEVFLSLAAQTGTAIPDSLLGRGGLLQVGADGQQAIRSVITVLGELIRDPSAPLAVETVRRHAERSVREAFLTALTSDDSSTAKSEGVRVTRRYHRLRLARDYITAHMHEPVMIEDLCQVTGLRRRSLENLFRELLGLSPTTYLLNLRLQGARHALLRDTPASATVKSIALDWGFWHLGRFSGYYHRQFGEYPAETLARRSQHLR